MAGGPRQVPLTSAMVLINLAVFALMLMAGSGLWHSASGVPLAWGASFGPATQDGQWWRLLTAMFVHFGLVHLVLNMWALWDVGRLVERLLGPLRFALLYAGSGLIGNLLSLVVQGNQAVSGGASGAIFGLYGAMLVSLWRERAQVERREFRWVFGVAVVFALLTLGMGWLASGIDNAAHLGGLISGACLSSLLPRRWSPRSPALQRERGLAALALVLGIAALVTHIPEPTYLMGDELRARAAIRQFLTDDQRVSQRWNQLLAARPATLGGGNLSFDELAGHIEDNVTAVYDNSFEQLTAANPGAGAPSAKTLEDLQNYAALRADASRALADGLRHKDQEKIRQALDKARQARSASSQPPASAATSGRRP
ncbi:MAG: rhomboid family intramembrane serine protease [Comamonadaceae bacterium]|nr:rhomboid family intramembrane serine protease [Comamonadaceae bacterium]